MIRALAIRVLPAGVKKRVARAYRNRMRKRQGVLPPLSKDAFHEVLTKDLGLGNGDLVFVHSSTEGLQAGFSPIELLQVLRHVIGPAGTMLFPTYGKLQAHEFVKTGKVFDVRKTASYTGLLTELARRDPAACRSLHPTKSVCGIGPRAAELLATHQDSPYPFDWCSPYFRMTHERAIVIGLGVSSAYMSFVHCADDLLKDDFPVEPYLPDLFNVPCVDADGKPRVVSTYVHDSRKMTHDVPGFVRRHVPDRECRDLTIGGRRYFRAESGPVLARMIDLARRNVTIYPAFSYKWRRLIGFRARTAAMPPTNGA